MYCSFSVVLSIDEGYRDCITYRTRSAMYNQSLSTSIKAILMYCSFSVVLSIDEGYRDCITYRTRSAMYNQWINR